MAKEINFIRPQEVYDRNTGESKVRYRSYDGNDRFIPVMDREKGVPKTMVEVTHAELKAMRDNGKLTAGALYRITDYQCTTTQENTQSAGHQFDIVLLALSEDKLAEEGWAMEHPTDVYDVTFDDGVTKKCYWYQVTDEFSNIVEVETLLGVSEVEDVIVDENNKTITLTNVETAQLETSDLTYNYFQNSNLSAWKVWYCLDNDTSRFAWADDGTPSAIWTSNNHSEIPYYRDASNDIMFNNVQYYAWHPNGEHFYTTNQQPSAGDILWHEAKGGGVEDIGDTVTSFVPASNDGRGVIYRLIDEWNNDVGYDFKNIQFVRPCTDGQYDENGEDTWCYTFSINSENGIIDASINMWANSNKICGGVELSDNVRFGEGSGYIDVFSRSCTILNSYVVLYGTENEVIRSNSGIFFGGKKVLTEK